MKINQHLKEYLTFTKSERNGIIVLLFIIITLISVRYYINRQPENVLSHKNDTIQDKIHQFETALYKKKTTIQKENKKPFHPDTLFNFDPNQASHAQLEKLGFTTKQINALKNYIKAGGRLYKKEDVKKIYGISPQQYNTLLPYIKIDDQKPEGSTNKYLKHQATQPKEAKKENQKVRIDINTAEPETLQKLYGIGPVFAERIIKYRKLLGGFYNTQQLLEVYGLENETYNNIQNMIYADTTKITRLNLNKADYKTLLRHPYLNNFQVEGLIRYRKFKKNIRRLDEVIENNILPKEIYTKMKHYFTVK